MHPRSPNVARRRFLAGLGAGAGALLLGDLLAPREAAAADPDTMPLLVFAYFRGGWDTLLSLDPRSFALDDAPGELAQYHLGTADLAAQAGNRVHVGGVDRPFADYLEEVPSGLVTPPGSNITFGPAIGRLADHFADLCVVRGLNMGSLTHEVGRRHFLTGKPPRGLTTAGNALPTALAAVAPEAFDLPNLVVGASESVNEDLDPAASALHVATAGDLATMLAPLDGDPTAPGAAPGPPLVPAGVRAAIDAGLAADPCLLRQLNGAGAVDVFRAAARGASRFQSGALHAPFVFPADAADPRLCHFGVRPQVAADLEGPQGQALIAAIALTCGLSQAVSITPATNLDTHADTWARDQFAAQRAGFDAIADLVTYLKRTPDRRGIPFWKRTTLVLWSEFSRTPTRNEKGGRDHHLAGACVVAGPNIAGNRVVGGTDVAAYAALNVDPVSGAPVVRGGVPLRPADVHATLRTALSLPTDALGNQAPAIVEAMLGAPATGAVTPELRTCSPP